MSFLAPPKKLTPARVMRLAAFLADPLRPAGTLRIDALHGFLFALLAAPENPRPSEWMPRIFNGGEAIYEDGEEMQDILGSVMALYNEVNAAIVAGRPRLPKPCRPQREPLANFGPTGALGRWATGFKAGHLFLADAWTAATPKPLAGELLASVYTLSYFADEQTAHELRGANGADHVPLAEEAASLAASFEEAMHSYAHIGRSLYQALVGVGIETVRSPQRPQPRRTSKVGRNDPCPCGSGRKFKHCCGASGATRH